MFSRNRVIQLTFSKDSILSKHLSWDLIEMTDRDRADTQLISNISEANGNIYLYKIDQESNPAQILLQTIKIIQPGKELILVLNSADDPFPDTAAVRQYVRQDTGKKYGLTLYSESEIKKLQKQKKVDEMTASDFKEYVDRILQSRVEMDSLSDLPHAPNNLLYYAYSIMRNIIGQLGYNPLMTNSEFDKLIQKSQNNPETKEIAEKLLE
jgi:hypothetical protein